MKGTECFVSVQTSVVLTELCNVMVNSEELIGTAEYRDAIDQMLHKPTSVQPAVTVFVVANVFDTQDDDFHAPLYEAGPLLQAHRRLT